ncbi:MAG: acyl dehydratase [Betaproteobacteria bacterium]|nr:acyl dehydratase [Betaproteobacteria bacterium]
MPLLFLHATLFRLQMTVLTHPAFPLPIWRVLQIRNRLYWRRSVALDTRLDLLVSVAGHRSLERGIEVDLAASVRARDDIVFENLVTFYMRGRFARERTSSPWAGAPALDGIEVAHWHQTRAGALRFGELTGDYNGIHLWSPYARLLGFKRAFAHPQRVLAQCLERISGPTLPASGRLDVWLKGPVYYGAELRLRRQEEADGTRFALWTAEDERPAIVGHLRDARPAESLAD